MRVLITVFGDALDALYKILPAKDADAMYYGIKKRLDKYRCDAENRMYQDNRDQMENTHAHIHVFYGSLKSSALKDGVDDVVQAMAEKYIVELLQRVRNTNEGDANGQEKCD